MPHKTPISHAHPDAKRDAMWKVDALRDELDELKRKVNRGDPNAIAGLLNGTISLDPCKVKEVVKEVEVIKEVIKEVPAKKKTAKKKKCPQEDK